MKYEFVKVDEDTTKLKYKEKEFTIVKDVQTVKELQNIHYRVQKRLIKELAKDGMSIDDIVIKHKVDGKTIEDHSSERKLENMYTNEITLEIYDELSQRITGMSLEFLLGDIGLETEKEAADFGTQFTKALAGNSETPS